MALEGNDLIVVQKPDTSLRKTTVAALLAAGGGSGGSITVQDEPPLGPVNGDLWWNSSEDSGRLFIYYDEGPGETAQWVDASPPTAGGGGDVTAGVSKIIAGTGISVDQQTGDVTITNTGGGGGGTVGTLQEVTDAGSTTDNDIEIGSIELNADGSASFAGGVSSYDSGTGYFMTKGVGGQYGFIYTEEPTEGVVALNYKIPDQGGGDVGKRALVISDKDPSAADATHNVMLGWDGSASFAGTVGTHPNVTEGGIGFRVDFDEGYTSYIGIRTNEENYAFANYKEETASLTFGLTLDGSATFAGDVKIGGTLPSAPNIELNADGAATFAGDGIFRGLLSITGTGSSNALYVGDLGEARISLDGSASFAGTIDAARVNGGDISADTPGITALNGSNTNAALYARNNVAGPCIAAGAPDGSVVAEINGDGSASFAGSVAVGEYNQGSDTTRGMYIGLGSTAGELTVQTFSTAAETLSPFRVLKGQAETFSVTPNGVVSASNVTYSLDDGSTMDVKRVGTALKALKAAAAAASDFSALKSAIATALADI